MKVHRITVGPLQTNCYLVTGGDKILIVDPGAEGRRIADEVEKLSAKPVAIVLTHGHWDHIGGVSELIAGMGEVPVLAHSEEIQFLADPNLNLSAISGEPLVMNAEPVPGSLRCYGFDIDILHLPGHSPGSIGLLGKDFLICGDTVFGGGSFGRTDLPGGNPAKLAESIGKILSLPDDLIICPGHGGRFILGRERQILKLVLEGLGDSEL